jgi:uncharacterized protein
MDTLALANDSTKVQAGDFGAWLEQALASFQGEAGTDVPCGTCRGCCTSSYFIHVRPGDWKTIGVVPRKLLSPAPGSPPGHKIVGFSANGSCALLVDGDCSIYGNRPQTCRDYDCRVFAAAGIDAGGPDKAAINRRIRQWRFSYASDRDLEIHQAIKAAASFIQHHKASFPGGRVPVAPSDIAVLAIKVHGVFLPAGTARPPTEMAQAVIAASREFEALRGKAETPGP